MYWFWINDPLTVPPDGGGICGGMLVTMECKGESDSSTLFEGTSILNMLLNGESDSVPTMNITGYGVRQFRGESESVGMMNLSVDTTKFVIYV